MSALAYDAFEATGLANLVRRACTGAVVLCYHNVVTSIGDLAVGDTSLHMDVERFDNQMRWLIRHYDVMPLREIVGRLERGAPLRGAAAVTFDDGYAGVREHAWPVLRELGIPATVFVVADAPDRVEGFWWDLLAARGTDGSVDRRKYWLKELRGDGQAILRSLAAGEAAQMPASHRADSWDAVRELAAQGCDVGVHSATHRALPELVGDELSYEIEVSREVIARRTGFSAELFSYPYGLWTEPVRRRVQQAGYRAAVMLGQRLVGPGADRWALPRINIPAGITASTFRVWAAGLALRRGSRSW